MFTRLAVLAGMLVFLVSPSLAQTRARLSGRLSDPSGAPIAGALVVAQRSGVPNQYRASTGADGRYELELPSGRYSVRISDPAFAAVERTIELRAGARVEWNPELVLEPLASPVTVTADAEPMPGPGAAGPGGHVTAEGKQRGPRE